jgi:hypothetical protein
MRAVLGGDELGPADALIAQLDVLSLAGASNGR